MDEPLAAAERDLLQLLSVQSAEDVQEALRALSARGALPAVVEAAHATGLTPLLYQRLRGRGDLLPAEALASLEADYWQVAAANTLRYHALSQVLGALLGAGIPVLVLKGAALAEALYGNVALRPMSDTDLLVHKADMRRAVALLESELGYRADWNEAAAGLGLEYENEVALTGPEPGTVLELHWHLIDAAFYIDRLPEAWLWEEAVPARIADHDVQAFSPEATLVHLAAHWVLHHQARGLRWLFDIAQYLRHAQVEPAADPWALDWDRTLALAQRWQLVLPLRLAVERCTTAANLDFSPELLRRLRDLEPAAEERRVYAYLTSPQQDVISRFIRELAMIQGWPRKLRYLWRSVFPTADYMVERYDIPAGRAVWPYHLYRVTKGLGDLARHLLSPLLPHAS